MQRRRCLLIEVCYSLDQEHRKCSLIWWKLFFFFSKKEMGLTRPIPFFSVNPACSLWFPITSHAGKNRTNLSFLKDNKKKLSQELGSQHRSSTSVKLSVIWRLAILAIEKQSLKFREWRLSLRPPGQFSHKGYEVSDRSYAGPRPSDRRHSAREPSDCSLFFCLPHFDDWSIPQTAHNVPVTSFKI